MDGSAESSPSEGVKAREAFTGATAVAEHRAEL